MSRHNALVGVCVWLPRCYRWQGRNGNGWPSVSARPLIAPGRGRRGTRVVRPTVGRRSPPLTGIGRGGRHRRKRPGRRRHHERRARQTRVPIHRARSPDRIDAEPRPLGCLRVAAVDAHRDNEGTIDGDDPLHSARGAVCVDPDHRQDDRRAGREVVTLRHVGKRWYRCSGRSGTIRNVSETAMGARDTPPALA
jgi:hypothetical protein